MNSQPHDRVEISDYPGGPTVAPLATPAPERGIKQVEGETEPAAAQRRQSSRVARIEHATPHFTFSREDGKLVLTRRKWRSFFSRLYWPILAIFWMFMEYNFLSTLVGSFEHPANLSEIVTSLFVHPSFDLVFRAITFVFCLGVLIVYAVKVAKLSRSPGDQLIFDRAAGTLTNSQSPNAPILLRNISEVNIDWQGDEYQVSLKTAEGGKIKIDNWYNEADALYTASIIADYIGVSVTQMETPISISRRRIAAITMIILLVITLVTAVWWSSLLNHVHLFGT